LCIIRIVAANSFENLTVNFVCSYAVCMRRLKSLDTEVTEICQLMRAGLLVQLCGKKYVVVLLLIMITTWKILCCNV